VGHFKQGGGCIHEGLLQMSVRLLINISDISNSPSCITVLGKVGLSRRKGEGRGGLARGTGLETGRGGGDGGGGGGGEGLSMRGLLVVLLNGHMSAATLLLALPYGPQPHLCLDLAPSLFAWISLRLSKSDPAAINTSAPGVKAETVIPIH
jgi:hypothetical protein